MPGARLAEEEIEGAHQAAVHVRLLVTADVAVRLPPATGSQAVYVNTPAEDLGEFQRRRIGPDLAAGVASWTSFDSTVNIGGP